MRQNSKFYSKYGSKYVFIYVRVYTNNHSKDMIMINKNRMEKTSLNIRIKERQ